MLGTITVIGLIVLAVLVAVLFRARRQDQISGMLEKRKGSAIAASRAEFSAGRDRMPVALSLTPETLHYENPDLEASIDVARIDEVEYDDELVTGHSVPEGSRVMRLRSHGTALEFVLGATDVGKWQQALPPRRMDDRAARVG